jgi:MFS family permease
VRAEERAGKEPLLSTSLFRNRTSNLGLVTQNAQWLMLIGVSFTVAAYLQVVRGYDPVQTGVIFTAATVGVLVSSFAAERLAQRWAQRTLIMAGFVLTILGIGLFLVMVGRNPAVWAFAPGLLLIGLGVGVMLTPSVNVVQSSFGEEQQGEISGLSRSISNLGSSLGTAIAGTILVAGLSTHAYGLAMAVLGVIGVVGLVAAALLPRGRAAAPSAAPPPQGSDPAVEPGTAERGSAAAHLPPPRTSAHEQAPVPTSTDTGTGSAGSGSANGRPAPGGQTTTGGGT